jgi:hypothetical protein
VLADVAYPPPPPPHELSELNRYPWWGGGFATKQLFEESRPHGQKFKFMFFLHSALRA